MVRVRGQNGVYSNTKKAHVWKTRREKTTADMVTGCGTGFGNSRSVRMGGLLLWTE